MVVLLAELDLVLVALTADVINVSRLSLATVSAAAGALVVKAAPAAEDEVDETLAVEDTVTVERVVLGKR